MSLNDAPGGDAKVVTDSTCFDAFFVILPTFYRVLMANLESRESLENQVRKEMLDHQDPKACLVLTDLL